MPAQSRHNLQIKGMYTCLEICDPSRTGGTRAPSCSCSRRRKGHRRVWQLMLQMTDRKFAAGKREMDQKTPCSPAMLAYHWREPPQVSFLLWQRHICRDKMCFVLTSLFLLQQTRLSGQNTSLCVCDKSMLVMTNTCVLRQKYFVSTNIILLQQAYFCCDKKTILVAAPANDTGRVVATTFQVDGFRDRVGAEKLLWSNQDHSCFNIHHSYPFSGLTGG